MSEIGNTEFKSKDIVFDKPVELENEIKDIYADLFEDDYDSKIDKADMGLLEKSNEDIATELEEAKETYYEILEIEPVLTNEYKHCPVENGEWSGERGNSTWVPDPEYIPQKGNPEGKTWQEILEKNGIEGIEFKDGEPDFSEISKGDVKIEPFSENRSDNFDKADIELAKQKGCTPEEVAKWRKENDYTWHECKDMETMQKVPCEVHNNIPHSGGISEKKKESNNE